VAASSSSSSTRKRASPAARRFVEEARAGLRLAVEERVAAADIGLQPVELADAVAQVDDVFFTGPAAVLVGRALAQERAEHTVLHVKHRHVLVQRELEPVRRRGFQQVHHLADVEVVGNR
jgi:hypothetical protein